MLRSVLLLVLSFGLSPIAHAHGDGDLHEINHTYEELINIFQEHLLDVSGIVDEGDIGSVKLGGVDIPVSLSAMNRLLALAKDLEHEHEHVHEVKPEDRRSWVVKLISRIASATTKKLDNAAIETELFLMDPVDSVQRATLASKRIAHNLKELYLMLEGLSVRGIYSFDPATALVLIVSQGLFEAVESKFNPMHGACTYFNTLLMGGLYPMSRFISTLGTAAPNQSYFRRALNTIAVTFTGIKAKFKWFAILNDKYRDEKTVASYVWKFAKEAFKENWSLEAKFTKEPTRSLASDLATIFDQSKPTMVRYYVALSHNTGLAKPVDLLAKQADQLFKDKLLRGNEYLNLEANIGRLRRIVSTMHNSTLRYSSMQTSTPFPKDWSYQFMRFEEELLSLFGDLGTYVASKMPEHEGHAHAAFRGTIWDLTVRVKRLTEAAEILRSGKNAYTTPGTKPIFRTSCEHEWAP